MCLKVKHKFEGVTTPCTMQDAVTWRALLQAITATFAILRTGTSRVLTATTLCGIPRAFLLIGSRLLLGSFQVYGSLSFLLSLERCSLGSTTCHGLELSLADEVLEIRTWSEDNVHRLDVVGSKLVHCLSSIAGK